MLRRRFLTRVGPLICAFVVGAILAVWSLQELLAQYDRAATESERLFRGVEAMNEAVEAIHADPAGSDALVDRFARAVEEMSGEATGPAFASTVRELETVGARLRAEFESGSISGETVDRARSLSHDLAVRAQESVFSSNGAITRRLRMLVIGLTVSALLMVNVAVFVLLRTAQMVLSPVSALVEGSRELAAERFGHRVRVERDDEFGELARAYNHLAEELEQSEERKAEALRQLAVTLNHSLNNAMSIIELQLGMLDREVSGNPVQARHLREIRTSLLSMAQTVSSLHRIRRVVLTDYTAGQRMVDLKASVAPDLPITVVRKEKVGKE